MTPTIIAMAALLVASAPTQDASPAKENVQASKLASEELSQGRTTKVITTLEKRVEAAPQDPALLINLGIAHAQNGADGIARTMFERALVSPDPIELETADGDITDSRRLARKAIRMLERGEFTARLSRRD